MSMPPPPPVSNVRVEGGRQGPGVPPPDEPVSKFVVCMNVTNTVTHLLLGAIAFSAFLIGNSFTSINIWSLSFTRLKAHIILTVIGYVILVSQAVLSLNPESGWGDNLKYPKKTKVYWSLQVLGSLVAFIGGIMGIVGVAALNNASISVPGVIEIGFGSNHLATAHQIVGLIAMILTSVSLVGGLANLLCTNLVNSNVLKYLYTCVMTLAIIIAFIAMCLAFDTYRIIDAGGNMSIAFTVLALAGMLVMLVGNFVVGGGKGI